VQKVVRCPNHALHIRHAPKAGKAHVPCPQAAAASVSVHRANLMEALGIHRTAELVLYAVRKGLVRIP